eukprot:552651_1
MGDNLLEVDLGTNFTVGNRTNDMSDNLLEVNLGTNFTVMGNNLLTVDLGSGFHVIQIAAGTRHNCALSQSNALKCWGYNRYGQLGLGDISNRGDNANEMGNNLLVVDLGTDFNVTRIAGGYHNCAVSQSNAIKCWGYNKYGQLGLGDSNARGNRTNDMSDNLLEVNLGTNFTVTQIVAGQYHTCVLSQYSTIKCWGCNKYGQLGLGTNSFRRGDDANEMGDNLLEVDLGTNFTVTQIVAGQDHTCALSESNAIKCWGSNGYWHDRGDYIGNSANEMGN